MTRKNKIIMDTNMENPTMHCQNELEEDLQYSGIIPDNIMLKWFNDRYSTSKHLLTIYSIVKGSNAKTILEIGFGRSSFILAKAAYENHGHFFTCDTRDFSYLLNENEKKSTTFIHGLSDLVWKNEVIKKGIDFAFLDYFSGESISKKFCLEEIKKCLSFMKTNGVIVLHDTIVDKYELGAALSKLSKDKNIEFVD